MYDHSMKQADPDSGKARLLSADSPVVLPGRDSAEGHVHNGIAFPVLEIEVPPLRWIHRKSLAFHRLPKQITGSARLGRTARVGRKRPRGKFVVVAGHLDFSPGRKLK